MRNRYYVQFESDIGNYYYTGMDNGLPCFTPIKSKAYRFYSRIEAQQRASKFGGNTVQEVII